MWNIGVGPIELLFLVVPLSSLVFFRGVIRRWIVAMLPFLALAILLTPADPFSTLLVGLPLIATFALGVVAASYVRREDEMAPSSR